MTPTVIDLFAGVGGLSLGFEMAGFNVLLANEYDESIATAYKMNHPKTKIVVADITELPIEQTFAPYIGKTTVVVGGPPCQGFSQKGQRRSINDPRNFLFKHYCEVVALVKPIYFVIENVPNLLTTEGGLFKNQIVEMFNKLGYSVTCGVLKAVDFGVPQDRRRTCIIGKRGDIAVPLPKPIKKRITVWKAISDLNYLASGEGKEKQDYRTSATGSYQIAMRKGSSSLYNHIATRHSAITLERLELIPPNHGREMLPAEHLTKSIYCGTWCRMKKDGIARTITTRYDTPSSGEFTHPFLNRAITTREAARLQSFPDSFIFYGSKSSQMKQVGNAVPPLLAKAIADQIIQDIKSTSTEE